MATSEARKRANKKWNDANMAKQTVTVRRETLEEFRQLVQANGDKVNTILRQAIENYIKEHSPSD